MVPTEPSADVVSNVVVDVVGLGRAELDEELVEVTDSDEDAPEDELSLVSGGLDELVELLEVEVVEVVVVELVDVVSVVSVVSVLGTSVSLLLDVVGTLGVVVAGGVVFSDPEVSPPPSVSFWRLTRILWTALSSGNSYT